LFSFFFPFEVITHKEGDDEDGDGKERRVSMSQRGFLADVESSAAGRESGCRVATGGWPGGKTLWAGAAEWFRTSEKLADCRNEHFDSGADSGLDPDAESCLRRLAFSVRPGTIAFFQIVSDLHACAGAAPDLGRNSTSA